MKPPVFLVALVACTGLFAACDRSSSTPTPDNVTGTVATADVEASCVARGWASQNGGTTDGGTATPTVVTTYDHF